MSSELRREPLGDLSVTDLLARIATNMYGAEHNAARWNEIKYRAQNHMHGKRGHALLSRAQVRAVLGPLLERKNALKMLGPIMEPYWELPVHKDADGNVEARALGFLYDRVEDCMVAMVYACARALLALQDTDPSPLEGD